MAQWQRRLAATIGSLVLGDMATAADQAEPAGMTPVDAILACHDVPQPERRLACYDAAATRLGSAAARRDVVVIDRAQALREREAAFGLPRKPKAAPARREPPIREAEERRTYDGTIASVGSAAAYQTYVLRLADGTAWRTIEAGDPPSSGEPIHITRGPIGNYLANIKGRRAVRIERVR